MSGDELGRRIARHMLKLGVRVPPESKIPSEALELFDSLFFDEFPECESDDHDKGIAAFVTQLRLAAQN